MRRPVSRALAVAVTVGAWAVAAPPAATAATGASAPATGVPTTAPPAAFAPPPALSPASGWPFPGEPPSTSGVGRLDGGASYWSDFVYDDYGARGVQVAQPVASLAPQAGTYTYASPGAHGDGADILSADVGLSGRYTYWRVDWTTLADPTVPVAEWAIDLDDNPTTGATVWPYSGLHSPGEDRFLVVHAGGAFLVDPATGARTDVGPVSVTTRPHGPGSFVVRVPTSLLPVAGASMVRLASGVWDPTSVFAPVGPGNGALPGQPPVYNVAFRTVSDEAPSVKDQTASNYQNDAAQAAALTTGDVSGFARSVNWGQLARRVTTPDPLVRGYSERWYLSSQAVGDGVVANPSQGRPGEVVDYPGAVQPYAVYIPRSYRPGTPAPLTWVLHSLDVNHNQYGVLSSNLLREACEDRGSICATTEGRGPDGWYFDLAELDFWQVWNRLAAAYTLDPNRTLVTGYSMGGYAAYKLGLTYPDLFAGAVALAGPPVCGLRVYGPFYGPSGAGRCTPDGDTLPLVGNAQWLPYVMADGVADELVPIPGVLEQINAFDAAGERYDSFVYPAEDHMVYATQDGFAPQVAAIGNPVRVTDPGEVRYSWYPDVVVPSLGIGPAGVYWVRGLAARDTTPGTVASLDVVTSARPDRSVTAARSAKADLPGTPSPAVERSLTWQYGKAPVAAPALKATLSDVAALTVLLGPAGFAPGAHGTFSVTTDGPVQITLAGLAPGQSVRAPGEWARAGRGGTATIRLPRGTTTITF